MTAEAGFRQSKRVPYQQRQLSERLWNEFAKSKKHEIARNLLQSKELRESPKKFGDERFLEEFILEKHNGWGFNF